MTVPEGIITLTDDVFREGYKGMGNGAFRGCESLQQVQLPVAMAYISCQQFMKCTALTTISIPASVANIGDDAFQVCSKLQTIEVHAENPAFSSEDGILYNKAGSTLLYCPAGKHPVTTPIGEKVTAIGRHAFLDCVSLKKLMIPAHVSHVGDDAFPRKGWGANAVKRTIEVEPGAGSGSVGEKVFDIDEWENPLVYPKLPVTFVKEQTTQVRLGLGFCMEPTSMRVSTVKFTKNMPSPIRRLC